MAKIEHYYDANKNGIDDDGSVWTSIAVVKTADLSGLTSNPNDTSVPAEMMLGHGLVGWNVQLSPDLREGAVGQVYIQVTQANLTISSHNATQGSNPTSATSNATNILNETNATENFYATSGNLTSENRTIPIKIGNPTVAAATSGSPIPSFEAAFAVVGLVIVAYVVSRRR